MLELDNIYNEDCLGPRGMRLIPDGSVDLIFADLPYGTTQNKWDSVLPLDQMWQQYWRVLKPNGVIVLTASQPFTSILVASNLKDFRYEWIWRKNKASGHLNAKKMPLKDHESVLVFYRKQPTYNPQMTEGHKPMNYAKSNASITPNYGDQKRMVTEGGRTVRYPKSVQDFDVVNNDSPDRYHPTQKPLGLAMYFIRTYTNEGDVVLDNCAGSGTTPIACMATSRRYLAFEWSPVAPHDGEYVKAKGRMEKHMAMFAN